MSQTLYGREVVASCNKGTGVVLPQGQVDPALIGEPELKPRLRGVLHHVGRRVPLSLYLGIGWLPPATPLFMFGSSFPVICGIIKMHVLLPPNKEQFVPHLCPVVPKCQ